MNKVPNIRELKEKIANYGEEMEADTIARYRFTNHDSAKATWQALFDKFGITWRDSAPNSGEYYINILKNCPDKDLANQICIENGGQPI